jgi:hypothetical protein
MSIQADSTAIQLSIVVEAPLERAFRVFVGSECQWARVRAFEPPSRLVFSWPISPRWQIETELDRTSEVEVRFIAETAERTRVELEHRNLDAIGLCIRHRPGPLPCVAEERRGRPCGRRRSLPRRREAHHDEAHRHGEAAGELGDRRRRTTPTLGSAWRRRADSANLQALKRRLEVGSESPQ